MILLPTRHKLKENKWPPCGSEFFYAFWFPPILRCNLQTSNTYLEIHQRVALPPLLCQRSHKYRSMCRSPMMRLSLERQLLNTAGRHAFLPLRPGEPAGFSAPGHLVYFYKSCLPSKCWLSCNFGSSIHLCVFLLLSGGRKRLRLLTTGTDRGWAF